MDAAAEEFVARGYDATRVIDIADRVGVTSGAVYARWRNKTEVVVAALDHIFQQILPNERLADRGAGERAPSGTNVMLGQRLLEPDERRDVMVQVFGSARNNEHIRQCLQQFLNEEAEQLSDIIEEGKQQGLVDPEISTAAMTLLCQAAALGIQLLVSAEADDRQVPAGSEWNALLSRLIDSVGPPSDF